MTLARSNSHYKWYKPILVGLVFSVVYLIFSLMLMTMVLGISATTDGMDIYDFLKNSAGGYDTFDVYTLEGSLLTLGSLSLMIPALFLATKIIGYRPFGSYLSIENKWRFRGFFAALLLALAFVGIPVAILAYFDGTFTGAIRFTIEGCIACLILGPLQCIAEELIFRGLLMQTFGGWFRKSVLAVILQALPFMLMHPYNIYGKIEALISGLIMGFLAYITGGIEASSSFHIVNNMTLFILNGLGLQTIQSDVGISGVIETLIIGVGYLCIIAYERKRSMSKSK